MHSKKSRNKSIFLKICVKQTGESGKIYRYSTSYPQVIHKMWIILRKPIKLSTMTEKQEKSLLQIILDETTLYEYN